MRILFWCLVALVVLSGSSASAQVLVQRTSPLTKGLVLWMMALPGRTGGTRWVDMALGHVGTLTNFAAPPTTTSGFGKSTTRRGGRGEIRLDGSDDWVTMPHRADLNTPLGFTLMMWVKTNNGDRHYLMTKNDDSWYWAIGPSGQTINRMAIFVNGVGSSWLVGATDLNDNQWHCLAATWNGATKALLIDGRVDASVAQTGTNQTGTATLEIFRRPGSDFPLLGFADDVMIYRRGLSVQEVQTVCKDSMRGHPQMLVTVSPWDLLGQALGFFYRGGRGYVF